MKSRPLTKFCLPRRLYSSLYCINHRLLCASSYPLSCQESIGQPFPPKTIFKQDGNEEQYPPKIYRLCGDKELKEAIEDLCRQKRLKDAVKLLEHHREPPSEAVYLVLLQYCIHQRSLEEGKRVYNHIKSSDLKPRIFIYNKILDLFCKCGSVDYAQNVFDEMRVKDLCSWNTLITGYAKEGRVDEARKLFDRMPERDEFSWTSMVSGYVKQNKPKDALRLYKYMQKDGSVPNKFALSSALAAVASIRSLRLGREIHGHIVRSGWDSDGVVWSALSDMYAKCGNLDEARYVFDRTLEKDVVSWTAMIDRCFGDGRWEEGFLLFSDLLNSGITPNDFTFAGVLNGCAQNTFEGWGKQVHGYMMRLGFDPFSFAASALVHMYSKCGDMECAYKAFNWLPRPDLVSWTSLINGYAQNGRPHEALRLFELLLETGIKPDHVTFVGVLSSCTHAGLVDQGLRYFRSIKDTHRLDYTVDQYACVIDLLSRAGRFTEAENIISNMPMKPDKFVWASLLGGCRIHRNPDLASRAAEALFEIEPENAATYVTLANIYASAGRWADVANVRKRMDEKGLVKNPGISWIDMNRKTHVFLVGDQSHPRSKEIYDFLGEMSQRMKAEGYVPNTEFVLHDVEEEQKEQNLFYHSEKLAVAFGIIASPPGKPLKVFKNLRICGDCHSAIKFISKISDRRIIVRDSSRFHHFEGGSCSCKDYW